MSFYSLLLFLLEEGGHKDPMKENGYASPVDTETVASLSLSRASLRGDIRR